VRRGGVGGGCGEGVGVGGGDGGEDKPAFIKRLVKVLVVRNLFLVHSNSC